MRFIIAFFSLLTFSVASSAAAQAALLIKVDRSEQVMRVYVEGELQYVWPVSTGKRGHVTPTGSYRPYSLRRYHRSTKYSGAPMPFSIFYRGGYAIHGTGAIRRLGSPASHGCVRLHISNARELYQMVKYFGKHSTRIVIHH